MEPLDLALVTDETRIAALANDAFLGCGHQLAVMTPERIWADQGLGRYDAVLVDLSTASRHLKMVAAHAAHTIAIGVTGQRAEVIDCMRAGADDYVPPDADADALRDAIELVEPSAAAPAASLEFDVEDGTERRVPLGHRPLMTIGRDVSNDVVFDSQVVSRFHAVIRRERDAVVLEDRGSRHGVLVNGERLDGPRELRDGDAIRLGKPAAPTLTFRSGSDDLEAALGELPGTSLEAGPTDSNREIKGIATLLDTFLQLNADLVLDDVLALVISRSIEFAVAERGMILLLDDGSEIETEAGGDFSIPVLDGRQLRLAMARNLDGTPVDPHELSISHKVPQQVLESGEGQIVEDFLSDDRADQHLATIEMGLRSAMCVPLRTRQRRDDGELPWIGVLYVDSRARTRSFSQQVLHALQSLAREAAEAIVNARLYQVSLEKRQIDKEMGMAREIQANLLPPNEYSNAWMELSGASEPSKEVGGDVLDYFPHGDEYIGLLVGDVSGKGVPAAIFSAMLDGHFHALSNLLNSDEELGVLARELNRYLVIKSSLQKFVTLFFGVLHVNGHFAFVNAGHNPPIVVNRNSEVYRLKTGGIVMGVFDDATYESETVELAPDDVLVLFSDGVTESRNPQRELFGDERLESIVVEHWSESAEEIRVAILAELERFTEGAPAFDDVTLMVVKRL